MEIGSPPTAYDRLLLARKYAVDNWIVPALTSLCERMAPISLDEARGMTMEDVVLIATIREDIRTKAIRPGVKPAEISRRVEAMQAGTPIPAADYEVAPKGPPSEVIDLGPGSMVNVNIGPGLEVQSGDCTLEPPPMTPQGGEQMAKEQLTIKVVDDEWAIPMKPKKKKKHPPEMW